MKSLFSHLRAHFRQIDRCDVLMTAGFCALCYGLWLAWPPLAFIIGGVLLLVAAYFLSRVAPQQGDF